MANHNHNPLLDGGNNQLVPAPTGHDEPTETMLLQQPFASPHMARTPSVVTGGMDASGFINALRRRWMLATFMGLLLAGGAAVGLYLLFPESDTAEARFLVEANPTVILTKGLDPTDAVSFDIFRATQVAQMKSFNVLQAALTNPTIIDSKILRDTEDAATWLAENLNVAFEGDSELMRVSLTESVGNKQALKDELRNIVDAVCQAYLDEVVNKNRLDRAKVGDALNASSKKIRDEIRSKWDEYRQISKDLGVADGGQFDPTVRVLFDKLSAAMDEKTKLLAKQRDMQLEYANYEAMRRNPDLKDQMIESQVLADPNIQMMQEEVLYMQAALRDATNRSRGRMNSEIQRMQEKIALQQQNLESQKQRLRAELKQQQATTPDIESAIYGEQFQRHMYVIASRIKQLNEGYDVQTADGEVVHEQGINEMIRELESKAEGSTELFIRKADLEQLERVASDLGRRLESWEIESSAGARIKQIETAHIMPGINKLQRYLISGLGGVATFFITCLGIAYLEFMGRRLNGPNQVDEGLGIRVVGTLPKLKAKHQAQITESIDSVRTALMHESTSKQRQVVLVTSPRAMEGRTTVASQLAGSLARAGRRTLLIDGDLRRPALHGLFNVPLEDGLSEVLRAEAEVADVVRATEAEGLWLMTAGYCDADAVHAMATDQIQPIFEKLRTEYDFVIIDGAPVLGISDPLMMGQHCDGALLSVLRDYTTVPDIYQSSELLRSVGIRLIGSVVNGIGSKADRRVNHLQMVAPKSHRKQLEAQPTEAAVASEPQNVSDDDDFDFTSLGDED